MAYPAHTRDTRTRTGRGGAAHMLPRVPVDRNVYDLACERMAEAMDTFDHVSVAFSGGKDSTAVLNVALQVADSAPRYRRHLPLRVVHADEECIPYETEEYVRRTAARDDVTLEWYCLPFTLRNACSRRHPEWWPWAPEDRPRWARPLPREARTQLDGFPIWPKQARLTFPETTKPLYPPSLGNVACLMGIRAQESLTRHRALTASANREHNWQVRVKNGDKAHPGHPGSSLNGDSHGNVWKVYPIYDWRTEDVWTAPAKLGWDYNRAYDLMAMAGVPPHSQRCSPAFGEEPMQKLHLFAECFPDVWARMTDRVPGVGAAYRYARTELYGHGTRPEKPAELTWPQFIHRYAERHGQQVRPMLLARLTDIIRRHYRTSSHPILPYAHHPETGVSWDFLLTVAMRGDFKARKQPHMRCAPAATRPDDYRKHWRRYCEELAALSGTDPAVIGHPRALPADPWSLPPAEVRADLSAESAA